MMTVIGSAISWTNSTWNWATGCTQGQRKPAALNCYASAIVSNRSGSSFTHKFEEVTLHENRLAHTSKFRPRW